MRTWTVMALALALLLTACAGELRTERMPTAPPAALPSGGPLPAALATAETPGGALSIILVRGTWTTATGVREGDACEVLARLVDGTDYLGWAPCASLPTGGL